MYYQCETLCLYPKDVQRMSPSNISRTSPKDPIWPFERRSNLTYWERPKITSRRQPSLTPKGCSWEDDSGCSQDVFRTFSSPRRPSKHILGTMWCHLLNVFKFSIRIYWIDQVYLKAIQQGIFRTQSNFLDGALLRN